MEKDCAIIIVNRDRNDLTTKCYNQMKDLDGNNDVYIVDIGSKEPHPNTNFYIKDDSFGFGGKCYGHNYGFREVLKLGIKYRYYLFTMNDVLFTTGKSSLKEMIRICDRNPKIAVMSPTQDIKGNAYPGCKPIENSEYHKVSTCDYLCLLVNDYTLKSFGFLNPKFKYSRGAIHEYAFKLYANSRDNCIVYCDKVSIEHLGGTTYGKVDGIMSREEYEVRGAEFALKYFLENYGADWADRFSLVLPEGVTINTFKIHNAVWVDRVLFGERIGGRFNIDRNVLDYAKDFRRMERGKV